MESTQRQTAVRSSSFFDAWITAMWWTSFEVAILCFLIFLIMGPAPEYRTLPAQASFIGATYYLALRLFDAWRTRIPILSYEGDLLFFGILALVLGFKLGSELFTMESAVLSMAVPVVAGLNTSAIRYSRSNHYYW